MEVRLLLGTVIAAGLAQLLTGCGGSATLGPDLVFVSSRDGRYAIYAMSSDGGHQVRLTERLTKDGGVLSAERVFFQVDPAWSPDGRKIAFASRRRGTFDIYVMNPDGTGARALAATPEDESHPTWSPDGTQLAFERGDRGDIYVMNADGTRVHRVTQDPEQEIHPAWSPDGRWIVFVRRRPETRIAELWLVRPDGSRRHALTLLRAGSLSPAWSPDGGRIAFSTNASGTRFEIYRIGVNGEGLRRVTHSSEDAFEPAWSPDGRTIAFSRGGSIVITDLNGHEEALTDSENNDSSPVWNPVLSRE